MGFQIEEAHWFYEDFVREQNSSLPGLTLKNFSFRMFQHCPLLHKWAHDHEKYYNDFLTYKLLVPVCGAIILNPTLDKVFDSDPAWSFALLMPISACLFEGTTPKLPGDSPKERWTWRKMIISALFAR